MSNDLHEDLVDLGNLIHDVCDTIDAGRRDAKLLALERYAKQVFSRLGMPWPPGEPKSREQQEREIDRADERIERVYPLSRPASASTAKEES